MDSPLPPFKTMLGIFSPVATRRSLLDHEKRKFVLFSAKFSAISLFFAPLHGFTVQIHGSSHWILWFLWLCGVLQGLMIFPCLSRSPYSLEIILTTDFSHELKTIFSAPHTHIVWNQRPKKDSWTSMALRTCGTVVPFVSTTTFHLLRSLTCFYVLKKMQSLCHVS